jgi:dipeptidase D
MLIKTMFAGLLLASAAAGAVAAAPSDTAINTAKYAATTYRHEIVDTLARLVSFNTVADKALPFEQNPQHTGFKAFLKQEAARLGFDFADHGQVVIIGLGSGSERVGVITHGDVQPVDPSKWKQSPFVLDKTSEAGRLIARGAEDDKGPIATALYAMKAIADRQLPLGKRIELYVYMAEESDWGPLTEFLKTHVPPQVNITLDAEYPAVTAEKGYGTVSIALSKAEAPSAAPGEPAIARFGGGFFASQIPEDAQAVVSNATPALEAAIRQRGARQGGMEYKFTWQGSDLAIAAKGLSAHSSKPEEGVNAISMLADALAVHPWADTQAGGLVNFLNEMIGTGIYGEKFGNIAYRDKLMGPMTFAPTVIRERGDGLELSINLRRPQGKEAAQLSAEINAALAQWQARHVPLLDSSVKIGEPWVQKSAPQLPTLLSVFSYFTGIKNPKPVAVGGGTNSRLFPNAVSFGPAMPGSVYTGHSEHEFMTVKQLLLNLQMYTAVLVELAQ